MHWLQEPTLNSERDFVAALPKRLLAHPRGPIAFVGHVDTAWFHGFDDPNNPLTVERSILVWTPSRARSTSSSLCGLSALRSSG